ncbi:hypothetical protein [Cellulomonas endometrii]|uniref:hypothetical protein n=1 Tax=Cellulomonas endometrii TaxID=3036301 RepID=UPI0024AD877E|nr:hypothetical protein [Cellulomonas endometrii]
MGLSVKVLPDGGAPQVGVTVTGLPSGSSSVVTVERSTDGVSWELVRGAVRESVTGAAFFRDFVPPLNVEATYRVVTDAALAPAAVYAWSGAANASASTETRAGVVTRTNLITNPNPVSVSGWVVTRCTVAIADGRLRMTVTDASGAAQAYPVRPGTGADARYAATAGTQMAARIRVRNPMTKPIRARIYFGAYTWSGTAWASAAGGNGPDSGYVTFHPGEERVIEAVGRLPDTSTATHVLPLVQTYGEATVGLVVGDTVDLDQAALFIGPTAPTASPVSYFDGATPPVPASTTAAITVPSASAWLQDPLNPRTAIAVAWHHGGDAIHLLSQSAANIARKMPADVVQVQGARVPVASLGVRQAPSGVLLHLQALAAEQGAFAKSLRQLFDEAGTVVMRGLPAELPLDPVAHVIAPDLNDSAVVQGVLGHNEWQFEVTQVRAPSPRIAVPWWTYDQVRALWSTYSYDAVKAARPGASYLDWLRDPTPSAAGRAAKEP